MTSQLTCPCLPVIFMMAKYRLPSWSRTWLAAMVAQNLSHGPAAPAQATQ
jgi:hypothetical protein